MPPRVAAIVNPAAGGSGSSIGLKIRQLLPGVTTCFTERAGHATTLARELVHDGYDCIITAGGDGTVNEVVNGFFDGGKPINAGTALAVLPLGTGGDFRRSLDIRSVEETAEAINRWNPRPIDAGIVTYVDARGIERNRYFINVVSFGMGGAVAARAKERLRILGGGSAFFLAAIRTAVGYRAKTVELELDGRFAGSHTILNIAIGNGRFHGGGMHVCPLALLDDEQLDVTVIDSLSLFELIRDRRVLYSDNIYSHERVHHRRAARITARSQEAVAIEVDGEPLGYLPLTAEVIPHALCVLAI